MATDSAIGYGVGTISDYVAPVVVTPDPTYSDSFVGYSAGTIDDFVPPVVEPTPDPSYGDSLIGYSSGTIDNFVPVVVPGGHTDSYIGYASGTVDSPVDPSVSDSQVGYAVGTIVDKPSGNPGDSAIGFVTDIMRSPIYPIGVFDGTKVKYVPLEAWTGTEWSPKPPPIAQPASSETGFGKSYGTSFGV